MFPTTERVDFFPPLGGSAGNSQPFGLLEVQSPRAESRKTSVEEPSSMFTFDISTSPERISKGKGRARQSSTRFSEPRRQSFYNPHTTMGTSIGQSSHVRRRLSEAYKPSFVTWSRRVSRQRTSEHGEEDEAAHLLANDESSGDFAAPSLFMDGQNALGQQADKATRERKMSVQDFVYQIEEMSRGQLQRSIGPDPEDPGKAGLVRRDSPWLVRRRVSQGAADADKGQKGMGKGKVLSEVGEEGSLAPGPGSAFGSGYGSMRMMSGEGSEAFV